MKYKIKHIVLFDSIPNPAVRCLRCDHKWDNFTQQEIKIVAKNTLIHSNDTIEKKFCIVTDIIRCDGCNTPVPNDLIVFMKLARIIQIQRFIM